MSGRINENVTVSSEGRSPRRSASTPRRPFLTIITPAYNEEANVPLLHGRLRNVLDAADVEWEWILVDDHSHDDTFGVFRRLAQEDMRLRGIRFSRNFGAHAAVTSGLMRAQGDCAIVIPADLQTPPEVITEALTKWQSGVRVVWIARRSRANDRLAEKLFASLYHVLMRCLSNTKGIPAGGVDGFLVDRVVIDAFRRCDEGNVSVFALIQWMGFSQDSVECDRDARTHGRSGWSMAKKLKLAIDSVTAFSYVPIRLMSLLGIVFAFCGICFAALVVIGRLVGFVVAGTGYAAIMTVLLLGFGFLMTFLGVLGEYVWRIFDEVRGRPRFLIERATDRIAKRSLHDIPNTLRDRMDPTAFEVSAPLRGMTEESTADAVMQHKQSESVGTEF